jgi:hypothetical protein
MLHKTKQTQQVGEIYQYKNMTAKFQKTNAANWFNKMYTNLFGRGGGVYLFVLIP